MDMDAFDVPSDCSSELSETQSELESRIYSYTHHNDFSETSEAPYIDPKYGVEFNSNGEAVVYLKDPADVEINPAVELPAVYNYKLIPTIDLDKSDEDVVIEISNNTTEVIDSEYTETSLKKKKKKRKKNPKDESIEEYIKIVKTTNALEEYKEKSGINKMNSKSKNAHNVSLNVAFHNERAAPMTSSEVLKQYRIGKPTECSLWYRCPQTWTSDMVKFYTRIQKSKRNFDCSEELKKIRDKYGSDPVDWMLGPMDLYKSYSQTSRNRCNICRQHGHMAHNCKEQYKSPICIMCGMEGHQFHACNKKICLSCGTWQKKFTNNCNTCLSMSKVKCNKCNTLGHESNRCTESWRQFHNTISTAPEPESNEFAQSTSKSNVEARQSSTKKSEPSSALSTPDGKKINEQSPKTNESGKSKKAARRLKRLQAKKKHLKNKNSDTTPDTESINIDVNIQDVTLSRTLKKRNFFKKKKLGIN